MKVLIFLAVWRRPEITEICFQGIDRLRKSGLLQIDTLAVISEKSMIPLCKKYGIDFVMHKNEPLGEKKNVGLNYAMLKSWDYLLEIGSDDVMKNDILEAYTPYMESGTPVFGIHDFFYINSGDGQCRRYTTKSTYGAGRCISRATIEAVCYGVDCTVHEAIIGGSYVFGEGQTGFLPYADALENEKLGRVTITGQPRYRLWSDDIMKGLDNNSGARLYRNFIPYKSVPTEKALLIDIKSEENIWAFNPDLGEEASLEDVLEGLSDAEKIKVTALIKKNQQHKVERAVCV